MVVPWQLSTGSIDDYLFCYCPLVGILFEVLRTEKITIFLGIISIITKIQTCSMGGGDGEFTGILVSIAFTS